MGGRGARQTGGCDAENAVYVIREQIRREGFYYFGGSENGDGTEFWPDSMITFADLRQSTNCFLLSPE